MQGSAGYLFLHRGYERENGLFSAPWHVSGRPNRTVDTIRGESEREIEFAKGARECRNEIQASTTQMLS